VLAETLSPISPGQIWAPVVSAIIVAFLALIGTYVTVRSNKNKAADSAGEAQTAAEVAKDAATAIGVKNAIIEGMDQRVKQLEETNERCEQRCSKLEGKVEAQQAQIEEMMEALRNASLLEREMIKTESSRPGSPPDSPGPSSTASPSA
jgi:peptidoglycan hydrolase CwlO-like protein